MLNFIGVRAEEASVGACRFVAAQILKSPVEVEIAPEIFCVNWNPKIDLSQSGLIWMLGTRSPAMHGK